MTTRVELKEKLDLPASEDLVETLKEHRGSDLTLDASAVNHMGAHALQTLIIAHKSWSDDGKALTLTGLPEDVLGQVEVLGASNQPLFKAEGS